MILIIDDDKHYTRDLLEVLKYEGFTEAEAVYTASDGLKRVHEMKPDVVVLDLMLPEDNRDTTGPSPPKSPTETTGFGLAQRLKESGFDLQRVVAITALPTEEDLGALKDLGIRHVLSKPALTQRILAAVRSIHPRSSAESQA